MGIADPTPELATKIEVLQDLEGRVSELMEGHERKREVWFPSELLEPEPDTDPEVFRLALRRQADGIPDPVRAALALNMSTEEGLPHFHRLLAVYLGATVGLAVVFLPAAAAIDDPALQRRVLARGLRPYNVLSFGALLVALATGWTAITDLKAHLGPEFGQLIWLLAGKLGLTFLLIVLPASFAASSSSAPSHPRRPTIIRRTPGACSPIPPVKTIRSTPPSEAASAATCRAAWNAKRSSASAASEASDASRVATSDEMPETPSRPDSRYSSCSSRSGGSPCSRSR